MDNITHIFLGTAAAYSAFGKTLGKYALFVAAIGTTLPDLDIFLRTGNTMRDHALHRQFTHSLIFIPVIAAIAALPFFSTSRIRPLRTQLFLGALLATATHALLDSLTSYGTQLFWPFSDRRVCLDLIAVVDPLYTAVLAIGVVLALRRRSPAIARAAFLLSCVYISLAWMQHTRAAAAQRELIALRGHTGAENARVLPQLGSILNYRSIYLHDRQIYADAIRAPIFNPCRTKTGSNVARIDVTDLRPFPAPPEVVSEFETYLWFTDGFAARDPHDPTLLGDMRYTLAPESFDAVWGLRLEGVPAPRWETTSRIDFIPHLWTDLFHPTGYRLIPHPIP